MIPERIKGLLEQAEVWIAAFKKETYEESFQKYVEEYRPVWDTTAAALHDDRLLQEQEEEIIRQQKGEEQKNQALKASEDMLAKEEGEMRIQMYDAIEKVIVYVGKEIDIHWKFDLSFENVP